MDSVSPNASETVIDMMAVSAGSLRDPNTMTIQNVHWRVTAGDYWVVAGPHGSGKSDFLMMTAGLIPPLQGSYRLFDQAMPIFGDAQLSTRLRLGLVFDGGQLFNQLTLAENIALPLRYHRNLSPGEAKEAVEGMLALTELASCADRTPGTVGRSWQKRAGLARALILRPAVLLLDNPLAGLDPRHAGWWLDFLGQLSAGHPCLASKPMTLVLTADNLPPWRGRARQFAVLKDKQFVTLGSQAELEQTAEPIVRNMLTPGSPGG